MVKEDLSPAGDLIVHASSHTDPIPADAIARAFDVGEGVRVDICNMTMYAVHI